MKQHLMLIKLSASEQVSRLQETLQSGQALLSVSGQLPEDAQIQMKILRSPGQDPILVPGRVLKYNRDKDQTGILVNIPEEIRRDLPKIANIKKKEKKENKKPSLDVTESPSGRLSFNDLKEIVSFEEYSVDIKKEKIILEKTIVDKKELTQEERQLAEPVAKFIMNLTKAMSRSGYYDPEHPSSKTAKKGLYDEFLRVAGGFHEIAFTNQKTGEVADIFITGILNGQVNVRTLVGSGVAELFVPKLSEYCERKQLISFAIKKVITDEHFNQFIDIMSDPKVDRDEFSKKGEYLTNALIEKNITEISTVFMDDLMALESELPWRVQMAIHRLAKDLRIMPMFKGISSEAIRKMKIQTVQDIIRPLNHPKYYNDFLVNCYIIAKNVSDMNPGEIENIIVEAFPNHFLLQTSRYTFQEFEHLQQLKAEQPDNPAVLRRLDGIRNILKTIASRVAVEKVPGAFAFFEDLYRGQILTFKELPVEAQYLVNARNMADDFIANVNRYSSALLAAKTGEDAIVYLKCFRRIAPMLIEDGKWGPILDMATLITQASSMKIMNSAALINSLQMPQKDKGIASIDASGLNINEKILAYVFMDISDRFISAFENPDRSNHALLEKILDHFGSLGVDILSQTLAKSDDKETRKLCVESLASKGELSRKWALGVLEKPNIAWYLHRNALMILRTVSRNAEDFNKIRIYLEHEKSKIREEMIGLIVSMKPKDADALVIKALDDGDIKVRWRATRALADISPLSESSVNNILTIIIKPISEHKETALEQMKRMTTLISAISGLPDIPNINKAENDIINALKAMMGQEKGLKKLFKRVVGSDDEVGVLKAAIPLLGRIGGQVSEAFLKKLIKSHANLSDIIQKSIDSIRSRFK